MVKPKSKNLIVWNFKAVWSDLDKLLIWCTVNEIRNKKSKTCGGSNIEKCSVHIDVNNF